MLPCSSSIAMPILAILSPHLWSQSHTHITCWEVHRRKKATNIAQHYILGRCGMEVLSYNGLLCPHQSMTNMKRRFGKEPVGNQNCPLCQCNILVMVAINPIYIIYLYLQNLSQYDALIHWTVGQSYDKCPSQIFQDMVYRVTWMSGRSDVQRPRPLVPECSLT